MVAHATTTLLSWAFAPQELLQSSELHDAPRQLAIDGLDLGFIPVTLRRRCSTFSKVTLAVAHAALRGISAEDSIPTVFASTHGESQVTAELLRELARDQQLSPMGFSLSVHNAASGLFSIATGNIAPASAISSESECLMMGLCEALTTLSQGNSRRVLLVCSDDLIAEEFQREDEEIAPSFALAMVLGNSDRESGECQLSCERIPKIAVGTSDALPHGVMAARWLASDAANLTLEAPYARWRVSRLGRVPSRVYVSPQGS
jgi:hypothetical protein